MWLLSRVQRLAGPTWGTGAFCPGWSHQPGQKVPHLSRLVAPPGIKGPNPFIPGGNTNRDKRVTLLSRLVLPTRTKGPFYPGWCYQPGQKASPRDSSKGSYSILSHVYYLGELARKPCVEQEVLGSNPVVSKFFFNVRHLLFRFFHPGQKPREAFVPEALSRFQNRDKSQFGTGTKGQICSSESSTNFLMSGINHTPYNSRVVVTLPPLDFYQTKHS